MISKSDLEKMARTLSGTVILGLTSGSPCARAGMRYGDILLRVNGVPIPNWQAYLDAKSLREGGMDIVYLRDGEETSISIDFARRNGEVDTQALVSELAAMRLIDDSVVATPAKNTLPS